MDMKTRIVRIGNARAVRIPKAILDQTRLSGEVEISVKGNAVVIRPAAKARAGWAEAFQEMGQRKRGQNSFSHTNLAGPWTRPRKRVLTRMALELC
jgi:antitoxin MazE